MVLTMVKHVCDLCESEIKSFNNSIAIGNFKGTEINITIKITKGCHSIPGKRWEDFDICKKCYNDAISKLTDILNTKR